MSEMRWADSRIHPRSMEKRASCRRGRRLCRHGGCPQKNTHMGMCSGLAMTSGCELHMARWVKTGRV